METNTEPGLINVSISHWRLHAGWKLHAPREPQALPYETRQSRLYKTLADSSQISTRELATRIFKGLKIQESIPPSNWHADEMRRKAA